MTSPASGSRALEKWLSLLGYAVFVVALVLAFTGLPQRPWPGALRDPDVKTLIAECGTADDPAGTGMPAWPDPKQRFYTRQQWTPSGDLQVQVWEFIEPGYVLVSARHEVQGRRLVIEPRWELPPNAAVAACHAKQGVEVTFHGLPRADYTVQPQ